MGSRFVFVYLMADRPDGIRDAVPKHVAYWTGLCLPGYAGGPFGDRSGGIVTFVADDAAAAEALVAGDPFVTERLLDRSWVKPWAPGPPFEPLRGI